MSKEEHTRFVEQHYDKLCEQFAYLHTEEYQQYCQHEDDYGVYEFAEQHDLFHDFVWYEFKNWVADQVDNAMLQKEMQEGK